jgi:hypothetical protein
MALNVKLYHWQTKSFARHKASDELFGSLLESIDEFVEVYSGRYKRPQFGETFEIPVNELTDSTMTTVLREYADYLRTDLPKYIKSSDTDLLTIRDNMLSTINQTLYLFTLN